jgi:hypothetical protein
MVGNRTYAVGVFSLRQPFDRLRSRGIFHKGVPIFALRAKIGTQKTGKYLAAEHPEPVEGQAKVRAMRATA